MNSDSNFIVFVRGWVVVRVGGGDGKGVVRVGVGGGEGGVVWVVRVRGGEGGGDGGGW